MTVAGVRGFGTRIECAVAGHHPVLRVRGTQVDEVTSPQLAVGMFPDAKDPVAVFMGMSGDGKKAVFLVDSEKYNADGEGSCKPSSKSCTFIQLGVSDSANEETLASADGNSEYTLKLLKINRVPLDQSKSNGASPKANGKARAKVARHERHAAETLSRFVQLSVFGGQG